MRCKVVYRDDGVIKIIRGKQTDSDSFFVYLETSDGVKFSISKSVIISVKVES